MSKCLTQQELESHFWGTAKLLRGLVDAADYKQYIFPLLFFKRLSDVWDEEYAASPTENNKNYACSIATGTLILDENLGCGCEFPARVLYPFLRYRPSVNVYTSAQVRQLRDEKCGLSWEFAQ